MTSVLVVDDEANVASSISRLLQDHGYTVLTADDGESALSLLAEQDNISVIISDQRMPKMTGSELLATVASEYPEVKRILLTGYADFESVRDAVNHGRIFRFLMKPWDDEELVTCVEQGTHYYLVSKENKRLHEELELAKQNLEHRIEQRTRVLNMNIRSLERYERIVEKIPMGILCVSGDGMIVLSNQAFVNIFGFHSAIEGMPYEKVLPEPLHDLISAFENNRRACLTVEGKPLTARTQLLEAHQTSFGKLLTIQLNEDR